jgi:hypothetical protein
LISACRATAKFLHRAQSWAFHQPGGWLERGSKACQQGCIEPVSFGELTEGLSEAAGVTLIDLRLGQASGRETASRRGDWPQ